MDLSSSNVFDPLLKPFITFGLRNILWQWVPQFNYALYEKVLPSVGLNLLVWQQHQLPLILRRTSEQPVPICFFLCHAWSDRPLLNLLLLSPLSPWRLLICLFFHLCRSCCPSLLILNAFLPALSSSAQLFWNPMARKHTTMEMQRHRGVLSWCFLICSCLFASSFLTWLLSLLMDFKWYLLRPPSCLCSMLFLGLICVEVQWGWVFCTCSVFVDTALHQPFHCPATQDHKPFQQCFVARFASSAKLLFSLFILFTRLFMNSLNTIKLVFQQLSSK